MRGCFKWLPQINGRARWRGWCDRNSLPPVAFNGRLLSLFLVGAIRRHLLIARQPAVLLPQGIYNSCEVAHSRRRSPIKSGLPHYGDDLPPAFIFAKFTDKFVSRLAAKRRLRGNVFVLHTATAVHSMPFAATIPSPTTADCSARPNHFDSHPKIISGVSPNSVDI